MKRLTDVNQEGIGGVRRIAVRRLPGFAGVEDEFELAD